MIEFIQAYQTQIIVTGCTMLFILACVMQVGKNRGERYGHYSQK